MDKNDDLVRVDSRLLMRFMSSIVYNEEIGESYVSRKAVNSLHNACTPVSENFKKQIFIDDEGQIYIWKNEDGEQVKTPIHLSGLAYKITTHLIQNEVSSIWELCKYSNGTKPDIVVRKTISNINKVLVDYNHGIDSLGTGIYRIY